MNIFFNNELRGLLVRSPIDARTRGSRRAAGLRLRRTPTLRYIGGRESTRKLIEPAPPLRLQDVDVTNTTLDLSGVAQKNFASVAFHSLWRIAHGSGRSRDGVCALVSILDEAGIKVAARRWIEFEPSCKLAFFRGSPADYAGDLEAAVGANLIVSLDALDWDVPFEDFATTVSQRVIPA